MTSPDCAGSADTQSARRCRAAASADNCPVTDAPFSLVSFRPMAAPAAAVSGIVPGGRISATLSGSPVWSSKSTMASSKATSSTPSRICSGSAAKSATSATTPCSRVSAAHRAIHRLCSAKFSRATRSLSGAESAEGSTNCSDHCVSPIGSVSVRRVPSSVLRIATVSAATDERGSGLASMDTHSKEKRRSVRGGDGTHCRAILCLSTETQYRGSVIEARLSSLRS